MAIADKNILITPNTSGILGNQPSVVFTGADSSIGDSAAITLTARPENTGTISFTGSAGQLFSVTNNLSGTIFAVNDVSGIPSLEINDAGIITMAEFNGRILLGGATDDSTSLLQLNGHLHLADNSEIRLGNDSDLLIYHTGSVANIINSTGDLVIADTNGVVRIQGKYGEQGIVANPDSSIDLYYDADRKFYTKSRGATVLGEIRADSANLKRLNLQNANGQAFRIVTNTDGAMDFCADGDTSKVVLTLDDEDGQPIFTFKEEGGTSILDGGDTDVTTHKDFLFDSANAIMFDKSDQALEVNSSLYSINLVDNARINVGTNNDLYIIHTGSASQIVNQTNDLQITNGANDRDVDIRTDDGSGSSALYFKADGSTGESILYHYGSQKLATKEGGVTVTGTLNADSADIVGQLTAGVLEGEGGATYDPPGSTGSETSTNVGLALHSGKRIVLGHNGYIRTIADATWGSALQFGQSGTGAFVGTEVYGGNTGVKLKYSTTTRFETLDSGVNITGNLRVNNAELASGASAGFAIAMAIAL